MAKVTDANTYASGQVILECGIEDGEEISGLSSSVFQINCFVDDSKKLKADIVPISQLPEIEPNGSSGTSGGGGGSGNNSSGSGGSGNDIKVFGLSNTRIERYNGEVYIDGLISLPIIKSTETETETEEKESILHITVGINNPTNVELLDELEVVYFDVTTEPSSLLEGQTLYYDDDYSITIPVKYTDFRNAVNDLTTDYALMYRRPLEGEDIGDSAILCCYTKIKEESGNQERYIRTLTNYALLYNPPVLATPSSSITVSTYFDFLYHLNGGLGYQVPFWSVKEVSFS